MQEPYFQQNAQASTIKQSHGNSAVKVPAIAQLVAGELEQKFRQDDQENERKSSSESGFETQEDEKENDGLQQISTDYKVNGRGQLVFDILYE